MCEQDSNLKGYFIKTENWNHHLLALISSQNGSFWETKDKLFLSIQQ